MSTQVSRYPESFATFASLRLRARWIRTVLLMSVFASLVTGCGFQLRGVTELPALLKTTYLAAEPAPADFVDALRSALRESGATLVEQPVPTGAVLKILNVSDERRVLSVNAVTGKVQEYELHYSVRFALADGGGKTLIEPQLVNLTRDFRFSETEVLGKSEEEAQLKREMRRELVQQLLRRIIAQTKNIGTN